METPLLKGEIVFDDEAQSFKGATLFVSLVDTTLADAPARTILKQVIEDVAYDSQSKNKLEFAFSGEIPDQKARYTVNALVDLDGDGRLGKGDYTNMQSYPVLTHGYPNVVSVHVKQVT